MSRPYVTRVYVEAARRNRSAPWRWEGEHDLRIVGVTSQPPEARTSGTILFALDLRIPREAFDPPEPLAVVDVPLELIDPADPAAEAVSFEP